MLHDDDTQVPSDDGLSFVLSEPAVPAAGRTLEVHQLWGETLLSARTFPAGHGAVKIGVETGDRWSFLGIDMGFAPRPLAALLPWVAPLWATVESGWRSDFVVDGDRLADGSGWTLFEVDADGGAALVADERWDGFVEQDGTRTALTTHPAEGGVRRVALQDGARVVVEIGDSVFVARRVRAPLRDTRGGGERLDPVWGASLALAAAAFALVGGVVGTGGPTHGEGVREVPEAYVEMLLDVPPPQPTVEVVKTQEPSARPGRRQPNATESDGPKAAGRKAGRRERDREVAERAGVLGALDAFAALDGDLPDVISAGVGSLQGPRVAGLGDAGLGGRGGDGLADGGGDGEALGGFQTGGGGHDYRGSFIAKGEGTFGVVGADPIVVGRLDPALVDEVVKRNLSAIRYCYQRELQHDPTLSGKVVTKFTIARDGSVSAVGTKSSTLGNAAVERCVQNRFLRMNFPAPAGGGVVMVSYPVVFSAQ
jgi:hypothetical protein